MSPSGTRQTTFTFLAIVVQLVCLVIVIWRVELESPIFYQIIAPLVLVGFPIHHLLPVAYRRPFFVLLTWLGGFLAFGLVGGLALMSVGLLIAGVLYTSPRWRIVELSFFAVAMAFLRVYESDEFDLIWPIMASLFMFRVIVYMVQTRSRPGSLTDTLSYFFLLPNLAFPLFPVIDYQTFQKTYYNDDALAIYQTGLQSILRGVFQWILYLFIREHLFISPDEAKTSGQWFQFLLTNFALYLRLSGQFHIIVGILHLFGFNLPVTNFHYFLSFSINDFWRRVNIYWKDFMVNTVFYPTYSRLTGRVQTRRLTLSLLTVILVTAFLHSYQWFWLTGELRFTLQDGLFWGIFGLLMIANSLYELRYPAKPRLGQKTKPVSRFIRLSLSTVGTFVLICLIWSMWTAPSLDVWLAGWSLVSLPTVIALIFVGLIGLVLWRIAPRFTAPMPQWSWQPNYAIITAIGILLLLGLTFLPIVPELTLDVPGRGYYEDLLDHWLLQN